MAGTTSTERVYPFSDFPNGKVNDAIFAAEISASSPAVSRPLSSINKSGTQAELVFDGLLVAADETQLNVLVAAHQGADFSAQFQRKVSEGVSTNDTETDVEKVRLDTGPLPAGRYALTWYAEVAATSVVAGTGASVGIIGQVNGGYEIEAGRTSNNDTEYVAFSGASSLVLKAGNTMALSLVFKRTGATSNPAKIRRARIFVSPQGA